MPKEHRKRGRREEKKRKREEAEDYEEPSKRQKSLETEGEDVERVGDKRIGEDGNAIANGDGHTPHAGPGELPYYGILGEDEQEYFKRADSMLELNHFADAGERDLFLTNVYKEANNKELKIANSQSCSRLMERLILLSTPDQLKILFQKFSGQ
jgi:nucleolar protein 9